MAVGMDLHLLEGADLVVGSGKDDVFPAAGAAFEVSAVLGSLFDEDFGGGAQELLTLFFGELGMGGEKFLQAVVFDLV